MQRSCQNTWCKQSFEVTDQDLKFYEHVSPTFNEQKCIVPPPKLCPDCRFQRRIMFRNDRHFYKRKSDKSGKEIITIYSPEKPYTVYDKKEWWADDWNPRDFGRDIDFSQTFTEQFQELRLQVPRANLFTSKSENSYYTNHSLSMKNCYLIWGGGESEDCMYGNYITYCKDTVDGLSLYSCEKCYGGIASERCYGCIGFMNCRDCKECIAVEDCSSCEYCIGCFGLHRKKYCLFNKELTKEEWQKKREELGSLTHEKIKLLQGHLDSIKSDIPHRGSHIYGSENCTGDAIYNSKNCSNCFDIKDCEDCKHVAFTPKSTSVHDAAFSAPFGLEAGYSTCSTVGGLGLMFDFLVYHCSNVIYSMECHYSEHLFGCVSMRHNEYCILNKQYSKEEYGKMAVKLVDHMKETGEWGEYFPPSCAPIAYNESNAYDYFPLEKSEAKEKGFWWRDEEPVKEQGKLLEEIPSSIEKVDDSICEKVLTCEVTGKQFKILPQELRFYRRMGIALPHKHPHQRHRERLDRRLPRKLWKRVCGKCNQPMETAYSPERPEVVFL